MRPQKRLLGISAPNNHATRRLIAAVLDVLNLEHINLRQPLINMLATTSGMHPTLWELEVSPSEKIEHLGHTVHDAEHAIALALRTLNHEYFINHAKSSIAKSTNSIHHELFDGYLISNVNTEAEAKWIRDSGGHVLHIFERDHITEHHPLAIRQGDSSHVIGRTDQINKQSLRQLMLQLLDRTQPNKKAAA